MRWPLFLLIGAAAHAQPSMPIGIVRGAVVTRTATELTVRNAGGAISACLYDAHTYFERDRNPIAAAGLAAGDPVEVVADRQIGSTSCYARTVQVVDARRSRFARVESATESFAPRGDLMFGGIVLRRGVNTLTLRTHDGEKTLILRPDTRYWCDGVRATENILVVNTRVFIRAGHDFEGNVEVYQAAWGARIPVP
jgi:hypothetical protein